MYINNLDEIQEYLNNHQNQIVAISVLENTEHTLMNIEFKKDDCMYKAQLSTDEPSEIKSIETSYKNTTNFYFEKFKKLLFINRDNRKLMFRFNKSINKIDFNLLISFDLNTILNMLDNNNKISRNSWGKNIYLTKENKDIYLNINNTKSIYDFNCNDKEAIDWIII